MLNISTIIVSQYLNSSIIFFNPALSVRHIAKYVKRRNERCHGKNGALSRVTRPHARVHTPVGVVDVSRRSSRQILFRKIGLPLSSTTERRQLCVGGSFRATNTRVTCARARLKNFRGYHPDLLDSGIQSRPFL